MTGNKIELATLAGGCFWCLEAVYERIVGVANVDSGYCGGHVAQPSYEQVCSETTGHAEAVQITFDSQIISYVDILEIFFAIHDPTTLNYQGYDVGTRYRSVIFYHDLEQRVAAEEAISYIQNVFGKDCPVVTELTPTTTFYPAEDYHRQYYQRNKYQPYCQVIISPKLSKIRKDYAHRIKSELLGEMPADTFLVGENN